MWLKDRFHQDFEVFLLEADLESTMSFDDFTSPIWRILIGNQTLQLLAFT
jgi:hypothetical protein